MVDTTRRFKDNFLVETLKRINYYREKKDNNMFDDFYHSHLDLMEDLINNEIERRNNHD